MLCNYSKKVLQILVFVHGSYIIHGDIKPNNLIRRESDGKIVLIDFGAVKVIQSLNPENQTFEKPENHDLRFASDGYTPLEQYRGKIQYNSDIYALGRVAIQALPELNQNNPSSNQNNSTDVKESQANESSHYWRNRVKVSDKLAMILEKMVETDITRRYQSATEVLNDLENL